jgi:hypothetical protein
MADGILASADIQSACSASQEVQMGDSDTCSTQTENVYSANYSANPIMAEGHLENLPVPDVGLNQAHLGGEDLGYDIPDIEIENVDNTDSEDRGEIEKDDNVQHVQDDLRE